MSTATEIDRFLAKFTHFGAEPSVESYLAFFHPDATLFDSGMQRPIRVSEIPEHIEGILKLAQGFRMTPLRWRFRAPTIFVEAHNRASLAGHAVEWPSVYCIDLVGDQVIRGRRYYDRAPLVAKLAGASGAAPARSLRSLRRNRGIHAPNEIEGIPEEPFGIAALRAVAPDLEAKCLTSAGDDTLLFREWELQGTNDRKALCFGLVDRFDLAGGRVKEARAYYDTLALGEHG